MNGVDHLGFIVAAYAVTAGLLLATVVALAADLRTQRQLLKRFGTTESAGE